MDRHKISSIQFILLLFDTYLFQYLHVLENPLIFRVGYSDVVLQEGVDTAQDTHSVGQF